MLVTEAIPLYLEGKKIRRTTWKKGIYVFLGVKGREQVIPISCEDYESLKTTTFLSPLSAIDEHGLSDWKQWELL